jgi:hypothetical protein
VVAVERDVTQIRTEIEQARDQLAVTVDQLADRLAPQPQLGASQAFRGLPPGRCTRSLKPCWNGILEAVAGRF